MFAFATATILLLLALLAITLKKTYYFLSPKELKRQAEQGDALARTLYRAVAYGPSLEVLLWLVMGLASAGGFVLLSRLAPWWLGLILIAVLLWLAFSWLPNTRVTTFGAQLARLSTPPIAIVLGYLHPVLSRLGEPLRRHYQSTNHTGVYEAEDLLELIERQKTQGDNRVPVNQLEAINRALTAHHYKISDVLTPRAEVKSVSDTDTIGLVLLDELHATKQSSFPVTKGKTDKVIGALYLHDLGLTTEGKVSDFMQHNIRYLHEDDSLAQALQAFFKTKHQLFVVVNSFEEYVGIVTLEHVVQQLMGEVAGDDFDQHDNLAAVANKHAHDNEPQPEPDTNEGFAEPDEVAVDKPDQEATADTPQEATQEIPAEEPQEPEETAEDPDIEAVSMDDESEPKETTVPENPDELAALDLPDDEAAEGPGEGSHITFQKPKAKKSDS